MCHTDFTACPLSNVGKIQYFSWVYSISEKTGSCYITDWIIYNNDTVLRNAIIYNEN